MTARAATRLGRPPLPDSERRDRWLHVRLSDADHATLTAWAAREGQPLAVLIRERSLRAARRG